MSNAVLTIFPVARLKSLDIVDISRQCAPSITSESILIILKLGGNMFRSLPKLFHHNF